jgi:hypothetical protein
MPASEWNPPEAAHLGVGFPCGLFFIGMEPVKGWMV